MKIIAFDLEACNRYVPGSIFSVGVVEADWNFTIIDKYSILINPETKFVTKFRKPIEFNIDEKSLKNEPNFYNIYPRLKQLFSEKALFIAHSISNDVRMLNYACKRYHLPSFKFDFICSQMIYSIHNNLSDGIGLDNAGIAINASFTHHQSDEDAMMALKIIEYICKIKNCTLDELIEEYGIKYGTLRNFEVNLMKSTLLEEQRIVRKQERIKLKEAESNNTQISSD